MYTLVMFRKIILTMSFLLFSGIIFSQSSSNLDEDFLKSLPEDLQDELSSENADEQQVDKLLNSKTSSLKNKEALKMLKQQIEELEGKINISSDSSDKGLQRYGDSFFSTIQSTFMPVNVPNLREDYILGIGDKLSLQIVGDRSEISDGLTIAYCRRLKIC